MKRIRLGQKLTARAAAAGAVAAALFAAEPASADPFLPAYLQTKYNLPCTPECTFCHKTNAGGVNNARMATKPNGATGNGFIPTLLTVGSIVAIDQRTWDPAFAAVDAAHYDTDGDGVPDIDELRAATDPMDASPTASVCGGGGPSYGCVRIARGASVDGLALATSGAVLFAGIALMRRRRAR